LQLFKIRQESRLRFDEVGIEKVETSLLYFPVSRCKSIGTQDIIVHSISKLLQAFYVLGGDQRMLMFDGVH
jgi:hypothetical protein